MTSPSMDANSAFLVFEPDYAGHRMSFCQLLSEFASARGYSWALATSSDSWKSEEFGLRFVDDTSPEERLDIGKLPNDRGIRYELWVRRSLKRIMRDIPKVPVVVMEGDRAVTTICLLPTGDLKRLTILVIRPPIRSEGFRIKAVQVIKALSMWLARIRGAAIVVLHPVTERQNEYRFGPWQACPDPVDIHVFDGSSKQYAQEHGLTADRHWYGIFGHIARRKNPDLVLSALLDGTPSKTGVLFAGKISDEERRRCQPIIEQYLIEGGKFVWDTRLLDDSELDSAIEAVDTAVFAHSGDGPSQIFGKALAIGTRVVVAGPEVLRREVSKFGTGTWVPLNRDLLAVALESARLAAKPNPIQLANGKDFSSALMAGVVRSEHLGNL